MKKLLIYFAFVITCAVSVYFGYFYIQGARFDSAVVPYVEKVLPQLSRWDLETTRNLLDEEALSQVNDAALEHMLAYLSRIGTLESFDKPHFRSTSTALTTGAVKRDVVTYRVKARYSTGEAEVTLSMVERGQDYALLHFNFQSRALAP